MISQSLYLCNITAIGCPVFLPLTNRCVLVSDHIEAVCLPFALNIKGRDFDRLWLKKAPLPFECVRYAHPLII